MTAAADPAGSRVRTAVVTTAPGGLVHFPCPSCGAGMSYAVDTTLECRFCGATREFEVAEDEGPPPMRSLDTALDQITAATAQPGLESELKCPSCGGTVGFSGTLTAPGCPYCGNPVQAADVRSAPRGRVPVDGIYPFLLDETQARDRVATRLKSGILMPNGFHAERQLDDLKRIYLPYLEFAANAVTDYTARGGRKKGERELDNGRTEDIVDWDDWQSGTVKHRLHGRVQAAVPAGSSDKFPARDNPRVWETPARPYRPEYVAGILCRPYEHDLETHWAEAAKGPESVLDSYKFQTHRAIGAQVPGDALEVKTEETTLSDREYRLVLYPFYLLTVRHRGKVWPLFVDGNTGVVSGEPPGSKVKVYALTLAIVLVIVLLTILF